MPITRRIDRPLRLITFEISGTMTAEEMIAEVDAVVGDIGDESGYRILSDHRGLEQPATPEQLRAFVGRMQRHADVLAGTRMAVVVAGPASYGMMRMLSVLVEPIPMEIEVFTDPTDARRWLDLA